MMRERLPGEFKERMQRMLRDESEAFFASYEQSAYKALRLNPLKLDEQAAIDGICKKLHLTKPVPWEPAGFYYGEEQMPGKHPYHDAGVYYIQEPSAMAPVTYLNIREGDRILDLCAAPGGKSTQIAGKLMGSGLLVSNEIHPARAKILAENMERFGVTGAIVTNETPKRLAEHFPGYFDKILVDAPCSGEGMFRKNPEAIAEWRQENVVMCATRQDEIMGYADVMLRPGGRLVYSTCTFAPEEDEGTIERFLAAYREYRVLNQKRFWPHKDKGEGHFLAVLTKGEETFAPGSGNRIQPCGLEDGISEKEVTGFIEFQRQHLCTDMGSNKVFLRFGDHLYALPQHSPNLKGLKVVRPGLELGIFMKNRFEPAHALSHALRMTKTVNYVNLPAKCPEIRDYLNGQALRLQGDSGTEVHIGNPDAAWTLICVDGFPLGWSKHINGTFKNHYPKGLRIPM